MRSTVFALVIVLVLSTAVSSSFAQAPARTSIQRDFVGRLPSPDVIANMRDRIAYWLDTISQATNDQAIIRARDSLRDDYLYFDGKSAGYTFAEEVAARASGIFDGTFDNDPLRLMKETNIAMAISQMPQVTIIPALESMVACKTNAAVRYFGWQGFRDARISILAQGTMPAQRAYDIIESSVGEETSLPVLEMIFRMLELDTRQPESVLADTWQFAQNRSFEILKNHWPRWCEFVSKGDIEALGVSRRALFAVIRNADWIGTIPEPRKNMLQMIVDLTWVTAKIHESAKTANQDAHSAAVLLRDCEDALNFVMQEQRKTYIERVLRDSRAQPAMIMWGIDKDGNRLGVMAWIEDLKGAGVVEPTYKQGSQAPAEPAGN